MSEDQPIKTPLQVSGLDLDDVSAEQLRLSGDLQRSFALIAGYDGNYVRPATVDRHGFLITHPPDFAQANFTGLNSLNVGDSLTPFTDGNAHHWFIYGDDALGRVQFQDDDGTDVMDLILKPFVTHDGTNASFFGFLDIWVTARTIHYESDPLGGGNAIAVFAQQFPER